MSDSEQIEAYDPDEVLHDRIDNWTKEFANRVHEVFRGDRLNNRAPMVRMLLVDRLEDEVREFLEHYDVLKDRNINRRYAEEFLQSEYDVPRSDLDTDDRLELLLVIYEHGLADELERIIFRSELFAVKNKQSYSFNEVLEISETEAEARKFMEDMNLHEEHLDPLLIQVETDGDAVFLQIYREYGRKYRRVFRFRERGEDNPPAEPSITGEQHYPLKNIGISIEPGENDTTITFTKDPYSGWQPEVRDLFDYLFEIPNLFDRLEQE